MNALPKYTYFLSNQKKNEEELNSHHGMGYMQFINLQTSLVPFHRCFSRIVSDLSWLLFPLFFLLFFFFPSSIIVVGICILECHLSTFSYFWTAKLWFLFRVLSVLMKSVYFQKNCLLLRFFNHSAQSSWLQA